MDEKLKLYMHKVGDTFFASNREDRDDKTIGLLYFNTDGLAHLPKYYKSLKGLAISIRGANYYAIDKTK